MEDLTRRLWSEVDGLDMLQVLLFGPRYYWAENVADVVAPGHHFRRPLLPHPTKYFRELAAYAFVFVPRVQLTHRADEVPDSSIRGPLYSLSDSSGTLLAQWPETHALRSSKKMMLAEGFRSGDVVGCAQLLLHRTHRVPFIYNIFTHPGARERSGSTATLLDRILSFENG